MSQLVYLLRHAWRGLRCDWGFTSVVMLSLGLGIGANAAVFSLVDQMLLRLLPVKAPEQLYRLSWEGTFAGPAIGDGNPLSHPVFRDLQAQNRVFEGMFGRASMRVNLATGGLPEPAEAEVVSGSYFSVLGVGAALGRVLGETDDLHPGAHPVVVVSHRYWKDRLGAAGDVVGRQVLVSGRTMTVVGVAAAGFRGLDPTAAPAVWIPIMMSPQVADFGNWLDNRQAAWLQVFGRLPAGVTPDQVRASFAPWWKAMLETDSKREGFASVRPEVRQGFLQSTLGVSPAASGVSQQRARFERPLLVLMAATGLVLLLACLNVANLCLARSFVRRRDLAVHAALGASRGQIARRLSVETAVLALAGGLLGLALAPWATQAIVLFLPPEVELSAAVDLRVVWFALAATVLTGVLFGVLPALQASRTQPALALKAQSMSVAGGLRLRKVLVVGQLTLSLVLLIGAGLFVRTLAGLRAGGPGFATTNLLTFLAEPGRNGLDRLQSRDRVREVLAAVRSLPLVESAGTSMFPLLDGPGWQTSIGVDRGAVERVREVNANAVSPGFFAALGVPLLMGRDFIEAEGEEVPGTRYRSAIVNGVFARRAFGARNPLGGRVALANLSMGIDIVGVVKDFNYQGLRGAEPQIYFPAVGRGLRSAAFYVRTRAPSPAAFSAIRQAVGHVDPILPVVRLRTLDDQLDQVLLTERMLATLASAFALLAILLTVLGLYGVMSFVVARRTREIGIRVALGATSAAAVGHIMRETAVLVAVGLALALPATWALGRMVESQLFGVQPMDRTTIAVAAAIVTLVALLASALPAHRAARVDPMTALRSE